MRNRLILPVVATLMLLGPSMAAADAPYDPCSDAALEASTFDFCASMTGPGVVTVKGAVSVGFGVEGVENGVAAFPVGAWSGDRQVDVNVRWDLGGCNDVTSPPCGFTVDICNDRNHDGACSTFAGSPDEMFETAASQGILGECKDQSKGCDDPNEAGWSGCLGDDVNGDWLDGQLAVFLGVEAGPNFFNPDVQAALSAGTYSIWVRDAGAC